jgi:hypothetical protein
MPDSRLQQIGAAGGIAFVILQMASQSLIQVGGAEPRFGAPAEEILQFFARRDPQLFAIADYLSALSLIAWLWFIGSLWKALRQAEGESAWLSTIALGSGLMVIGAATVVGVGWPLAVFRVSEGLDPQIARLHFDMASFAFVGMWASLASFLLATSVIILRTALFPRWVGWLGEGIAVGLLVARAFWASSQIAILPYLLFWLWLIATSVALIRRIGREASSGIQHAG